MIAVYNSMKYTIWTFVIMAVGVGLYFIFTPRDTQASLQEACANASIPLTEVDTTLDREAGTVTARYLDGDTDRTIVLPYEPESDFAGCSESARRVLEGVRSTDEVWTSAEGPTSADNAPPGSIHNLPVPKAVAAVRTYAAQKAGIAESKVLILTAYERQWPDSCLGLAADDEFCTQVITPGWEVTVRVSGETHVYRTNADGSSIRKQS